MIAIAVRFLLVGLVLLPACSRSPAEVSPAQMKRAADTLLPLKKQLMQELTAAMEEGPEQAVEVCRTTAPEIAASLATDEIRLGRTSHRLRNSNNAPATWVQPLLDEYLAEPDNTEPRAVRLDDDRFGYVEPIHVKPLCLHCHGEEVDPSLLERIQTLYPDDQATGFREGDLRGLFWVEMR